MYVTLICNFQVGVQGYFIGETGFAKKHKGPFYVTLRGEVDL
jgi:hypothetical protein